MSYYSDYIKNGLSFNPNDYVISDYEQIDELRKSIRKKQEELDNLEQQLSDKKEELICQKYEPVDQKRYIEYTRTNTLYDWDTCAPVDETEEGALVYKTNCIKDTVRFIRGFDFEKGAIIVAEYQIRIENAKDKLHHRFMQQKIINFFDDYMCNFTFLHSDKDVKYFINKFFDCPYEGSLGLSDIHNCFKRNKSFEIILRESPKEWVDLLLKWKIDEAMPLNKFLGLTKPTYNYLKEKKLLSAIIKIKDENRIYSRITLPTNESELIEMLEMYKTAAEDFLFYHINVDYYSMNNAENIYQLITKLMFKKYYEYSVFYNNYTLKKFSDYVLREVVQQGYTDLCGFLNELRDYLCMCEQQHISPTLYSSYLKQTHDVCSRNHKIYLDEKQEEIFAERYADYSSKKIDDTYMVVVPNNSNEIKMEGDALNHCVGSYIKRIIDGECLIFFLRKKENQSLITFEVREGKVKQIRGAHNRSPYPDEVAAINKYMSSLNEQTKLI